MKSDALATLTRTAADRIEDWIVAEAERSVAVAFAADGKSAAAVAGGKCSVGHIRDWVWVIADRSNEVAAFVADGKSAAAEDAADAEESEDAVDAVHAVDAVGDSMGFVGDGLVDDVVDGAVVACAELDYRLCRWFQ